MDILLWVALWFAPPDTQGFVEGVVSSLLVLVLMVLLPLILKCKLLQ